MPRVGPPAATCSSTDICVEEESARERCFVPAADRPLPDGFDEPVPPRERERLDDPFLGPGVSGVASSRWDPWVCGSGESSRPSSASCSARAAASAPLPPRPRPRPPRRRRFLAGEVAELAEAVPVSVPSAVCDESVDAGASAAFGLVDDLERLGDPSDPVGVAGSTCAASPRSAVAEAEPPRPPRPRPPRRRRRESPDDEVRSSGSRRDGSDASLDTGVAASSRPAGTSFPAGRWFVRPADFERLLVAGLGNGAPRLNAAMRSSTSGSADAWPVTTSVS
jgi:hypothetical protein